MEYDGSLWLAAVNLIIWTGLFLYLLRIDSKLGRAEKRAGTKSEESAP